ncbi:MAG: helix-turn-helix domain-containing protein [Blautia sp.]|nr:helix-turn-helix domain-containing protein [Lachnoclostridium sp.]MCM1210935.1 helix-turn-helix domain-containing protein [Blautia sp.]
MTDAGFGKRLSEIMERKNITNAELTKLADISKNNIGNYKNGQIPHAETLYRLSQILGTSMEYLLSGKETTFLTSEERKLIELYRNTNEIGQPLIMKHAEDIQKVLQLSKTAPSNMQKLLNSKIG